MINFRPTDEPQTLRSRDPADEDRSEPGLVATAHMGLPRWFDSVGVVPESAYAVAKATLCDTLKLVQFFVFIEPIAPDNQEVVPRSWSFAISATSSRSRRPSISRGRPRCFTSRSPRFLS